MSKELVISSNRHETKVAILEDDQLVEIYFQRANEYSLAGSIHKGRVTRVLPGMQSAFVDLGLDRDTFLYVSDFFEENEEYDRIAGTGDERNTRVRGESQREPIMQSAPAMAPAEEAPEPAEAPPHAVATPTQVAVEGGDRDRQDHGGVRGRRPRRRRNRGRGFPDSKYASNAADEPSANEPAEEAMQAPAAEVVYAAAAPPEPAGPVFLLPGESLAKYSQAEEPAAAVVPTPIAQPEPELLPEDIPNPGSQGNWGDPISHPDGRGSAGDSMHPAEPPPSESEIEDIRAEIAEALDTAEEEQEMEEGPEEPLELEAAEELPEGEAASPMQAEGVEPARQPQSLTAVLRDRDNSARFQNRSGRRMRRRGRGGPERERRDDNTQRQPTPESAAPPAAVSPVAPAPPAKTVIREKPPLPSITDLLKEGQEILVQIAKEPIGQKGARITSHIALPGRFCV